ncbi:hypothetical protein B0H10DRAFT_1955092 [Mycena sp. CBHHK59/15]|nr:hypothetical protein B0H10DRAFT_1955092 [Mycena sp. CBHHK59/15]
MDVDADGTDAYRVLEDQGQPMRSSIPHVSECHAEKQAKTRDDAMDGDTHVVHKRRLDEMDSAADDVDQPPIVLDPTVWEKEGRERQMLWKVRTQDEEARCKRRDQKKWGTEPWTVSLALERLRFQIGEFKHITFSEAQPLTFYVVPWPVLTTR